MTDNPIILRSGYFFPYSNQARRALYLLKLSGMADASRFAGTAR